MDRPRASRVPPPGASAYRERLLADVTRYAPGDLEEVLAFRREMYGAGSVFARADYFRWMFEACPGLREGRSTYWLFRREGRLEATQGAYPVRLQVGARTLEALWALDLMVRPAWRLRGIGPVLTDVALEERGAALGLEVSEGARRGLLRAGWVDCGTVPLWVRPFAVRSLVRQRLGDTGAVPLGAAAERVLAGADRTLGALLGAAGLRLERVSAFDARSDAVWERAAPHHPVVCRRDAESLNWRFARFPLERYRLHYVSWRGRTLGHLVLRTGDWNGVRAGFVVDYLCTPRWVGPLLALALGALRREGVEAAYLLHRSPHAERPLRALGFLPRDSSFPLMFRAPAWPPDALALASEPRSWFVTAADADVDRPREGTVFSADAP